MPAIGATGSCTSRGTRKSSTSARTSSSLIRPSPARATRTTSVRTRCRCSGTPSHNPTRSPTRAAASRSRAISSVRKFSVTNSCRLRPISFLRLGMIAVCGTGSPSGCRNSAVTANQSARAPTIAASAAVLTYPQTPDWSRLSVSA